MVKGCRAFHADEPKDPFYRVSQWVLKRCWESGSVLNPPMAAGALGVLAVSWNTGYYRGLAPDFEVVEQFLVNNRSELLELRGRAIPSFEKAQDAAVVGRLFRKLRSILGVEKRSPVTKRVRRTQAHIPAGKVLHMLAPNLLPLWDNNIAREWGCDWSPAYSSDQAYLGFVEVSRDTLSRIAPWRELKRRSRSLRGHVGGLLKVLDEWNYAKFTGGWIR